jgi:glycosyltransferase involved in cell wall biosynthesis
MRSVVLAAYQGEHFLELQLESILRQLSADDEIVVSDDASTDGTVGLVSRLCVREPRVRLITNSMRVGYVANFQRAIAHCRGDLVYFSDQDDVWLPDKVRRIDLALQDHACVASDATVVDTEMKVMHRSYFEWRRTKRFTFLSILARPPIIGATIACRRTYLLSLLPLPLEVPHDFWLSLNAAWDQTLGIISDPLILYRRHPGAFSVSGTSSKRPAAKIVSERMKLLWIFTRRRIGGLREAQNA